MPPKTEMITRTSVTELAANTRLANSRRSISASDVRRPWNTKPATMASPIRPGTMTCQRPKPPAPLVWARP